MHNPNYSRICLGTQGVQALCPRTALVYGVSLLDIVKVDIEILALRQSFETKEDKLLVDCF